MNRDDIIGMAQQTGWDFGWEMTVEQVCEFAALVAAAERERIKWDTIHSCHPECDKPVCVAIRKAVLEEREACAKVLDEMAAKDKLSNYYVVAALAIRERGAP